MSINEVVLIGRLTKDIEIKVTKEGNKVGSFSLAVQRNRAGKGGQVEADFIRCLAFNKTAENMEKYTCKGSLVGIKGHIQTGSYTDRDGKKVYTTDVACDMVQFLSPKESTNNSYANSYQNPTTPPPFSTSMTRNNPFMDDEPKDDYDTGLEIDSDDLPF